MKPVCQVGGGKVGAGDGVECKDMNKNIIVFHYYYQYK